MKQVLVLTIVISILFVGCQSDNSSSSIDIIEVNSLELHAPYSIASIGQSIDQVIFETILDNASILYDANPLALPNDLENSKTIFLIIGASKKGLSHSGITIDDELSRIKKLSDSKAADSTYVLIHMGGVSRRGEESDKLINESLKLSDALIVVEDGDFDSIFYNYAKEHSIPYSNVKDVNDLQSLLIDIFENE